MKKNILSLFEGISCSIHGTNVPISGIAVDSRNIEPGNIFFAYKGALHDGRSFVKEAVDRGAAAVCTDTQAELSETEHMTVVRVDNVRRTLSAVSARFWGHPSERLRLIGITGTNGKTTTAFFLRHILSENGYITGLIGTVRNEIGAAIVPAGLTTPESNEINRLLSLMAESGVETAIAEVSSQGIDTGRIDDLVFSQAVFTNLSGEHLDYHGTMERYFSAKKRLFEKLPESTPSIVNIDDPRGKILQSEFDNVCGVSMQESSFLTGTPVSVSAEGTVLDIVNGDQRDRVTVPRVGRHNCMNFLLAAGSALLCGLDLSSVMNSVSSLPVVPGRLEPVDCGQDFSVYIDYAHTDNALANVLNALKEVTQGCIITVFGAGGDRDRSKRPRMGETACSLSDKVIITNDNPRTEDPEIIINDILSGTHGREWAVIPDRKEAITTALDSAREGDAVLIAGKGHEDYQIIGTQKHHFCDRETACEHLVHRAPSR